TVYKLTPDGAETVLYSFKSNPDANFPDSGLTMDNEGNLYGTTRFGGANGTGSVFELHTDGTEAVLYSFGDYETPDGEGPVGGVIRDKSGNLFGTTEYGGVRDRGTVFELAPDGTESILASLYCGKTGCEPEDALIADERGSLYGTAGWGGASP